MKGIKHTEEAKRKMSEKHIGINNHFFGKNSEIFQTSVKSNDRINKLKKVSKIENASFAGKHHTEEAKKKNIKQI